MGNEGSLHAPGSFFLSSMRTQLELVMQQQEASLANLVGLLQNVELSWDIAHDPSISCTPSTDRVSASQLDGRNCEGNRASGVHFSIEHALESTERRGTTCNETPPPPRRTSERVSELIRRTIVNVLQIASNGSVSSQSSRRTCVESIQAWSYHVIKDHRFEMLMGFIILMNAIVIGIDTQSSLQHDAPQLNWSWTDIADVVFLIVYIIEMSLRLAAEGRPVLRDSWFISIHFSWHLASLVLWCCQRLLCCSGWVQM